MKAAIVSQIFYTYTKVRDVTSQKPLVIIVSTEKTSGLKKFIILGLWKRDKILILRKYECIQNLSWEVWKKTWEV
jgi:hypothetical protein